MTENGKEAMEVPIKYPKPIMTGPQLRQMGFPKAFLERAYKFPNQTFAWRTDPNKEGSMKIFDTAGFEKWRQEQTKIEKL